MPKSVAKKTERELAKKLGVNRSLVGRKRRQGKSDEQIAAEAKARKGNGHRKAAAKPQVESYADAQARKEQALADLREFEREERRGNLVDKATAAAKWAELGVKIREAIMAFPSRAAVRLPHEWRREVVAVLEDEARKALAALSDEIRASPAAG